jgi:hypothetical protein
MTTSVPFGFTCFAEPVGFAVGFVVGWVVGTVAVCALGAEADGVAEGWGVAVGAADSTGEIVLIAVIEGVGRTSEVDDVAGVRVTRTATAEMPMSAATASTPATAKRLPRRIGSGSTGPAGVSTAYGVTTG